MNTIPQDLAGYQNIIYGQIQEGDILVDRADRNKMWAPDFMFGNFVYVSEYDVYRKIDVPRHEGETAHHGYGKQPKKEDFSANAKTDDSGKPPLANLPWKALRKVSRVQAYGHKKYGDFYNYKKGMEVTRQLGCAVRHIADYLDGIDLDKESGESHLAHAACRLLFALENIEEGTIKDDRYKTK